MTAMDIQTYLAKENSRKLGLALFRISIGIMFMIAAWGKVMAGFGWGDRVIGFLNAQSNMPDFYRAIVDAVVIPNASFFGFLTAYGELFLALALIFGVLVRPAAVLGVFMVANFMLAKGHAFWVPSNHDSFYIFSLMLLAVTQSGMFLGFDSWVAKKYPKLV